MNQENEMPKPPASSSTESEENNAPQSNLMAEPNAELDFLTEKLEAIRHEIGQVIMGQDEFIRLLIISILADGHSLIEGVPGVAKTVTAKIMAKLMNIDFSRIQFTPDLLPSDVLGTSIFDPQKSDFEFRKGPVFANLVLIDEINRAPAKTQAALFEVMAERQITMDGTTYPMEKPFLVLATQNPIEQEGTYRLPEAQLDRFLFKIEVGYPSAADELRIVENEHLRKSTAIHDIPKSLLSAEDIQRLQNIALSTRVEQALMQYIVQIVTATRENPFLFLGASPRASLAILRASKAAAVLEARDFVIPEDVKSVAKSVLKHRIVLAPEKEMEGMTPDMVVEQIIENTEIPR